MIKKKISRKKCRHKSDIRDMCTIASSSTQFLTPFIGRRHHNHLKLSVSGVEISLLTDK